MNDNQSFPFSGGSESILGWAVNNDWKFLSGNGSEAVYYRIVSANTVLQADVLAEGGKITVSKLKSEAQRCCITAFPRVRQLNIQKFREPYPHGMP